MNTTGWIILIVVVVVVIAIIVVIAMTAGRRRKQELDRHRAEELRVAARHEHHAPPQREANASQAHPDAKPGNVPAPDKRPELTHIPAEARDARASVDEKLTKADAVDPDVRTDKNGARTVDADRTTAADRAVDDDRREPRHSEPRMDMGGSDGTTSTPPPPPPAR